MKLRVATVFELSCYAIEEVLAGKNIASVRLANSCRFGYVRTVHEKQRTKKINHPLSGTKKSTRTTIFLTQPSPIFSRVTTKTAKSLLVAASIVAHRTLHKFQYLRRELLKDDEKVQNDKD